MQEPDIISKLRLMRDASSIERAHIKPHLMRYSNGQHTHDLSSVLILCWKEDHHGQPPSAQLLIRAHVHDMGELVTGDVPSPTKDAIGSNLHAIDSNVERWLGLDYEITEEEAWYLDTADKFELWMWCWDEIERGNQTLRHWKDTIELSWRKGKKSLPPAFVKLGMLIEQGDGVGHMTNPEIKVAGGIS